MRKNSRYAGRRIEAFTLIELLVVIALTVILLTVLFAPLIQAFHFTEQAQAEALAQDGARLTTEQLSRELGNAAAVRDTTGNYLDIPLLNKNGNEVIAHAYNAYLDIVPPRALPGSIVDPTVDSANPTQNFGVVGSSGVPSELSAAGIGLPLAAGSTIIRWFVALRYPIDPAYTPGSAPDTYIAIGGSGTYAQPADPQPYLNPYDGLRVTSSDPHFTSYVRKNILTNTYQLYRANVQPFVYSQIAGAGAFAYRPNVLLFPTTTGDTTGATGTPIIDDPDFFRIVTIGEPDVVPGQGDNGVFTQATAQTHNDRVYNWTKLAKDVIATRDIDLVGLPRTGGKIVYDTNGNPVDSYEPGGVIPIVRTTMNFAPALISNDPMAPSNTSNASQGYGETPSTSLLPYVPALYQSQYGNWEGTPAITITKSTPGASPGLQYLQTRAFTAADGSLTLGPPNNSNPAQSAPALGDFILADVSAGTPGTPVFDITAGAPIEASGAASAPTYDALLYDKNRGVVSFAIPAIPTPPSGTTATNPPNTYFAATGPFNQYITGGDANVINLGDYQLLPGTPLPTPLAETATANPNLVPNATLVVNSERVVGPNIASGIVDLTPTTDLVQYTRVTSGVPSQADTYSINYQTNTITFPPNATPTSVQIAFSYQNNLTTKGTADTIDAIRASYYTAAIIRLNLGVRVYASATGYSQYFTLNSQVGVGNSKAN
jgi:type II secretory pathway pseudopilin PulG